MNPSKIKIFIFDDHDSVRESYKRWLQTEGFEIVGEERSITNCVQIVKKYNPDIILMDIDFPEGEKAGLTACKNIKKHLPEVKVVFVTHYNECAIVSEAFSYGADGYFSKSDELKFLKETIQKVYDGYTYTSPTVVKKLVEMNKNKPVVPIQTKKLPVYLTTQEEKVLNYIAQGLTNKEIAQKLATNEKRVKNIIANILVKLEAKNRAHAVTKGIILGIINLTKV